MFQKVSISTLNLEFHVSCRFAAKSESDSLFAAAAIGLEYLDNEDSVLGETKIVYATAGCTWQNSPTLHLIRVPDTVN